MLRDDPTLCDAFGPPHPNNPYLAATISRVNGRAAGLWDHLERVLDLEPAVGRAVLLDFLEQACLSQNDGNIRIGRYGIAALPRAWVLANIEAAAEPMLSGDDDWAYRRMLEVFRYLDSSMAHKLALRALAHSSSDIRGCGQDFLNPPHAHGSPSR